MIPMDFDNLLANRDMWGFQVRLSSNDTQEHGFRNTKDRLLVYRNLKFKRWLFFYQGLNTIKLVLNNFKESRFAANQVDICLILFLMY